MILRTKYTALLRGGWVALRPAAGLALVLEEAAAEGHLEVALRVEVGPDLARVWRFLDRPPRNDWRFSVKISTRGPGSSPNALYCRWGPSIYRGVGARACAGGGSRPPSDLLRPRGAGGPVDERAQAGLVPGVMRKVLQSLI